MNKIPTLVATVLIVWSTAAYAADNGSCEKLKRGVVNIVSSPVEIVKHTREYWIEGSQKTDHILVWLFSGAVEGLVETVKRGGSGVWDVLTFPVELPQDHESLIQPDYVWEEWPQR